MEKNRTSSIQNRIIKMTSKQIIEALWSDPMIEDILIKITSNNPLKEDLKSELFLILLEMSPSKIVYSWQNKWIYYMIINILKKQYHSKTSPFHKKFRLEKPVDILPTLVADEPDDDWKEETLKKINDFIENDLNIVDRELFKLYYKIGEYDRWIGELRDKDCEKPTSSYRKIEKKLTIDGVKVSRNTIGISHRKTIKKIKSICGGN